MQIIDFIKSRRSVHKYKKKKVSTDDLYYVLEAGRWAPSSGNIQNWRYVIVEDEDAIKEISKASLGQDWIKTAPVLIIVCSMTNKVTRKFPKFGDVYAIQNTAASIQNMLLGAMGVGLSTCLVTAFAHNRVRRVCNIPNEMDIHGIITLGYANERPVAVPRHDLWDITVFETWQDKDLDKTQYIKGRDDVQLLERPAVKNAQKKIRNIASKLKRKSKK